MVTALLREEKKEKKRKEKQKAVLNDENKPENSYNCHDGQDTLATSTQIQKEMQPGWRTTVPSSLPKIALLCYSINLNLLKFLMLTK